MMTRCGSVMLMALLAFSVPAVGQSLEEMEGRRSGPASFGPSSVQVSSSPAAALLMRRVDQVDWTDRTFEDVLRWLRDESDGQVNVVARFNHLGIEGIQEDSLISLRLNNTTVAEVLNETIEYLSDTGDVGYRATGNKLLISTRSDFERKMYLRVYDVTDVLFRVPSFGQGVPQIDLQQVGGQGGGGQSVFQGAGGGQEQEEGDQEVEQQLEERLNVLRELIEQTIAPESWDLTGSPGGGQAAGVGAGGGRGRIRVFNRSLFILNTIEVHEQIGGWFNMGE